MWVKFLKLQFASHLLTLLPLLCSLALPAALTGSTVLHLDKALAKIREYERMKLKSEFNPGGASPAGAADLSNAAHPAANSADKTEGTIIYEAANHRQNTPPF